MRATKTPFRKNHLEALAQVNDQICFVLFLDAHVGPELQQLAAERPAEYTPVVFPENPFAERIYVSMDKLVRFRNAQVITSLGVSFSFAVEQLLLYIESTMRHWVEINGVAFKIDEPIDACLNDRAARYAEVTVDSKLIKTVKYLRLRRNHVIHAASEPSAELVKTLKYDGPILQNHWEAKTTVAGVNFSSDAVRTFSADETISLVKVMRICIEELDDFLSKELNAASLLKSLDSDLLRRQGELKNKGPVIAARRVRKVKKRAFELYGLTATAEDVAHIIDVAL
jgi:hypothetical protein